MTTPLEMVRKMGWHEVLDEGKKHPCPTWNGDRHAVLWYEHCGSVLRLSPLDHPDWTPKNIKCPYGPRWDPRWDMDDAREYAKATGLKIIVGEKHFEFVE